MEKLSHKPNYQIILNEYLEKDTFLLPKKEDKETFSRKINELYDSYDDKEKSVMNEEIYYFLSEVFVFDEIDKKIKNEDYEGLADIQELKKRMGDDFVIMLFENAKKEIDKGILIEKKGFGFFEDTNFDEDFYENNKLMKKVKEIKETIDLERIIGLRE